MNSFIRNLTIGLALAAGASASGASGGIALFWGQNSAGASAPQGHLADYCANPNVDIIPISLVLGIKSPRVNFANMENGCSPIGDSGLIYCPHIEQDIKTCQGMGKKILISLGGDSYTEGGFSSPDEAVKMAERVFGWFGPDTGAPNRPFGSAIVDGFDFDFESTTNNLVPFARHLRSLGDNSGHRFLISASPQCVIPDHALGPMLDQGVFIDYVFVQFYNNWCGIQSYKPETDNQEAFNFAAWDNWAHTTSVNKNVKVLMGVPGNFGAGGGYQPADKVAAAVHYAKRFSSFGGVMIWDASQAARNGDFLAVIKSAIGDIAPVPIFTPPVSEVPKPQEPEAPAPAPVEPKPEEPKVEEPAPVVVDPVPVDSVPAPAPAPVPGKVYKGEWDQCGGVDYKGLTECEPGLICAKGGSEWWYSCKKPNARVWKA